MSVRSLSALIRRKHGASRQQLQEATRHGICPMCGNTRTVVRLRQLLNVPAGEDIVSFLANMMKGENADTKG